MNVSNQALMHIKAGHLATSDMLTFLLNKKPTAIGFMIQDPAGIQTGQEDGANLTFSEIDRLQADAKDLPRTLYFAQLAEGYHPEDIQPFAVFNDADPFLGIMIEGDIVGHNPDKVHTEHYNFVNGVLIPKISEICEDFDGDIEKILAKLGKDSFKNDVLMHVGHRVVLQIMGPTGQPVMVQKNTIMKDFDWGWVSNAEGYGVKAAEPVAAAPAKRTFGFGGKPKAGITTDDKGIHTVNSGKPTLSVKDAATPGTEDRQKKDDKAIGDNAAIRPPSWLFKNDDLRAFYELLLGKVPPNSVKKKLPVVPIQNLDLLKVKNYEEFKQYRLKKAMETTGATAQTKQERLSSTATPGKVDVPPLPTEQPIDPNQLPVLNPKETEKVLDFITKHFDSQSKLMSMPPQEMQAIEQKLDKLTTQMGLKLEETMNWPVSGLFALGATDVKALVMHLVEWRAYARPFLQAELKAKKKDNIPMTTETTTTVTEGGAKKVESVVKPAARKSFGFGGRKAA